MHPDAQRRLEARLDDDGYSCEKCCSDLPYTFWNTCPLCLCGLLPVLVVCFSALFRLDYATHVTDIGAQIINQMGLSYTVYYTAGCWPGLESEPVGIAGLRGNAALPGGPLRQPQCNGEHFEIAAGEFDALSGSLLRVRNVTKLHARRVEAVKVSPDWRYIVFVGALANDVGNLYAVGAEETDALRAVPLLSEEQLDALDAQCQQQSAGVLEALKSNNDDEDEAENDVDDDTDVDDAVDESEEDEGSPDLPPATAAPRDAQPSHEKSAEKKQKQKKGKKGHSADAPDAPDASGSEEPAGTKERRAAAIAARLAGFKHLQVIIPGLAPVEQGGDLDEASLPDPPEGSSLRYRAAFAFECSEHGFRGKEGANQKGLQFSKIATLDFQLLGINVTTGSGPWARSRLRIIDAEPAAPAGASPAAAKAVARFRSQSCPRFVPSRQGHEILFVAEDVLPPPRTPSQIWLTPALLPSRWLAVVEVPQEAAPLSDAEDFAASGSECCQEQTARCLACQSGKTVQAFCGDSQRRADVPGCEQDLYRVAATAALLNAGEGALPFAPVHGCPEFVPSLYYTTHSLAESLQDNLFKSPDSRERAQLEERKFRDTFVILSDPTSMSVLGVDAQVLAVSLPEGPPTGAVSRVHLLYNVDNAPSTPGRPRGSQLLLGGCQPIRAAGRKGHMRLQWALEMVMTTLQLSTEKNGYTAWLACLTADQRIAIVESPKREHWINMSMPYPIWTGKPSQAVWCPEGREDACFEVWSNPNPNRGFG